ncbi:hypothetical protein [Dolichospermum flos-aquae]|uniref:Uncharacterized protein n=1 Tax=Dolichospermum flos-aquae CCAP 1403/13F TaxID=315271 RepID=A0A6H2BTG4_DOLFA|nr:hypothetical protein [Dolichospermum flos-aquae]MBO1051372.1 hypothetical protein [Dolichospermum sp. DET73]QJB42875.1 hypothetical protein HGD76_24425 [Dolichospermum flos-aquae CCAP 1403/13F]
MSVGAKHLEDKLSVIAKNSSPNASPVQLLVVNFLFTTQTISCRNTSYRIHTISPLTE